MSLQVRIIQLLFARILSGNGVGKAEQNSAGKPGFVVGAGLFRFA